MKKLYIHVGLHKTGTTGIQALLTANTKQLAQRGVFYPDTGRIANTLEYTAVPAYAHHNIPLVTMGGDDSLLHKLIKEIKDSDSHTAVISSEVFMQQFKNDLSNISRLAILRDHFEVKIVFYLRRQDSLYESVTNQKIKDGHVAPPLNTVKLAPYYNYLMWMNIWEKEFGEGNIIPRVYEKGRVEGGSLYAGFAGRVLGFKDIDNFILPVAGLNPRLSGDTLKFKQAINLLDLPARLKQSFIGLLLQFSQHQNSTNVKAFQNHGSLNDGERRAIVERYREMNRDISRKYLKVDEDLFSCEIVSRSNDSITAQDLEPMSAANIALYLLERMLPDKNAREISALLSMEIVRASGNILSQAFEPKRSARQAATEAETLVEDLQRHILQQQRALDALRLEYSSALTENYILKDNMSKKAN